jgi:hypothetical protein
MLFKSATIPVNRYLYKNAIKTKAKCFRYARCKCGYFKIKIRKSLIRMRK